MNIALIAHDVKKDEMVNFVIAYKKTFLEHVLYATGTTGSRIVGEAGVPVHLLRSGPLGGDQQIGSLVAQNQMDVVLFFRDPLMAHPHEPDVTAMLRLCDVHSIPVATNIATAEVLVRAIERGDMSWRQVVHKYKVIARNGTEG